MIVMAIVVVVMWTWLFVVDMVVVDMVFVGMVELFTLVMVTRWSRVHTLVTCWS